MLWKKKRFLTIYERYRIEELCRSGVTQEGICKVLNRSKNCIRSELLRCPERKYNAIIAHKDYLEKKSKKYLSLYRNISQNDMIIIKKGLQLGYSKNKLAMLCACSHYVMDRWLTEHIDEINCVEITDENISTSLEERVVALEFQLEIILEIVRKNDRNFKD